MTTGTSKGPDGGGRRGGPLLVAGGVGVLLLTGLVGLIGQAAHYVGDGALSATAALAYGLLGPWIWLRAAPPLGRRLSAVGAAAAVSWCSQTWSSLLVASWLSQWSWVLPVLLVPLALVRFPDGVRPSGVRRHLELLLAATVLIATLTLAIAAAGAPRNLLTGSGGIRPAWTRPLLETTIVVCAAWLLLTVLLACHLLVECRRTRGPRRAQVLCLTASVVLLVVATGGLILTDAVAFEVVIALSLPLGCGVAVLRFSLYDLDLLVHRVAVWLVLSASVVVAVGAVLLVGDGLRGSAATAGRLLLLTALVLVLDPLRRGVQGAVDRVLFGHRRSPARALDALTRSLGAAAAQGSAERLCASVATTLALPWVGVRSADGRLSAGWGRPTSTPLEVPIDVGAGPVGVLLVCPRRAGERFGGAELRLIGHLATQVGVALDALLLAGELQEAREGLVRSREEERRRLRDDLHDGLGPALAGLRMQLHAVHRCAGDGAVAARLAQLSTDLAGCTAEVGRLVDGLRPADLSGGLATGLRAQARRLRGAGDQEVHVAVAPDLEGCVLPAAVEIAAYRIASEALSNALRHAAARQVVVRLAVVDPRGGGSRHLRLEIADDGSGGAGPREGGVGLSSMRERAAEVGGSLHVESVPGRGTAVRALLPLPRDGDRAGRATPAAHDEAVSRGAREPAG